MHLALRSVSQRKIQGKSKRVQNPGFFREITGKLKIFFSKAESFLPSGANNQ